MKKWWDIFVDDFTEVRILANNATFSGYFRDYDNLIRQMRSLGSVEGAQCYFVLNQIAGACYGRAQCERFIRKAKQTTTDNDIVRRRWVLIDLDPKRPAGVNSSDEELECAHRKALTVYKDLRQFGFSDPVVAMSGNGYHLLYKVDMEADGTKELIKSFLNCLSVRYGDDKVDVDEKVFNAGRICKLYGTTAKKGANIQGRPWRKSELVLVPGTIGTTDIQVFSSYVDTFKVVMEPVSRPASNYERFTLQGFMQKHGIRVYKEIHVSDGIRYKLEECPFDPTHKNGDAALFESNDGKVGFNCFHNSCNGKRWHDVRELFEPGYKERAEQWQNRQQTRQYRQPEPPQPKQENETDGRKWLPFSEIQFVDVDALPKVKTGFGTLDLEIQGLYYGEFIVLSGSSAAGKSSWINTLMLNLVDQGVKCALWSGELPAPILKAWIRKVAAGKHLEGGAVKYDTGRRIDAWIGDRLLIYNNNYGTKWEQVFSDMELLLPQGVQFFVLDNLMALDIDILDESKNDAQKKVVLRLKEFAKMNNVIVLMVAHPRKTSFFLRKEDISGSGDITNVADDVFIIHRINKDFYIRGKVHLGDKVDEYADKDGHNVKGDVGNVIEIVKNRMHGKVDKLCGLKYDENSRRFTDETDKKMKDYGWYASVMPKDYVSPADDPDADLPF